MTAYILDTETTGLVEPHMTEVAYSIVEIEENGVVNVVQEPRSKRFNPLKPISLGSMATSHICDEDVAHEPPHTDFKLPESVEYLIGHNIDYDMQVLKNAGVTHTPKLICTKALASHLVPELDSHKLTALLYYFHRDIARKSAVNAHAADIDIYFTQLVLKSLIDLAIDKGHIINSLADLYRVSENSRMPLVMPFGKHKGKYIQDLVQTNEGQSYFNWLLRQDNVDKYLVKAIRSAKERLVM